MCRPTKWFTAHSARCRSFSSGSTSHGSSCSSAQRSRLRLPKAVSATHRDEGGASCRIEAAKLECTLCIDGASHRVVAHPSGGLADLGAYLCIDHCALIDS